jgi:hypothetical protein
VLERVLLLPLDPRDRLAPDEPARLEGTEQLGDPDAAVLQLLQQASPKDLAGH